MLGMAGRLLKPHANAQDALYAPGSWPCPPARGGVPSCWLTEDTVDYPNLPQTLAPLWACPACTAAFATGCGYGSCPFGRYCYGAAPPPPGFVDYACSPCMTTDIQAAHRVIGNGVPPQCKDPFLSQNLTMCARGYYGPAGGASACAPCIDVRNVQCDDGQHPLRCITDLFAPGGQCAPCTLPPLPPGGVYGQGALFDDCSTVADMSDAKGDFTDCAFFQTPKWDAGYCAVHCAPGFALTAPAPSPFLPPTCTPCATACPPGMRPPACPGGTAADAHAADCVPCDASLLPDNASWTNASSAAGGFCEWACPHGTYAHSDAGVGATCHACVDNPPPACPAPLLQRWLGCGGASAGACAPCPAAALCALGSTYATAASTDAACHCVPCTRPVPGLTYARAACTLIADAGLAPCTVCAAGVAYAARPCAPTLDALCRPCTPPPPGARLLAPCNATADARYGACPAGYACDGTAALPFRCLPPRSAANGLCVCPPAMVPDGSSSYDCVPMPCPAGTYPDARTGACSACASSAAASSAAGAAGMMQTRAGYMGLDACGCPPGYVRDAALLLLSGADDNNNVSCWPCGDMGCAPGLEAQTGCNGFASADPVCACAAGPGMALVPDTTLDQRCAVECADGFLLAAFVAGAAPGLYGDYGFLERAGGFGAPWARTDACGGVPLAVEAAGSGLRALAVCNNNNGTLWGTDGAAAFQVPLEASFGIGDGVRGSITALALAPHAYGGMYAWLLFGFWGLCEAQLDAEAGVRGWCMAVELLSLACATGPDCLGQGGASWGRDFPAYGLAGMSGALAWYPGASGASGGALLLLRADDGALFRYDIAFYPPATLLDARAVDYPLPAPLTHMHAPRASRLVAFLPPPGTYTYVFAIGAAVGAAVGAAEERVVETLMARTACDAYGACSSTLTTPLLDALFLPSAADNSSVVPLRVLGAQRLLLVARHADDGTGGGYLMQVDPWNAVRSAAEGWRAPLDGPATAWTVNANTLVFVVLNATHGAASRAGIGLCDIDAFASAASGGRCAPMPCTRAATCAPGSVRAHGAPDCGCAPGAHYVAGAGCVQCPAGVFCPGGTAPPSACPDNALTLADGASSAADCLCAAGYYRIAATGECALCPTSLWCPFNGTLAPIACVGTTLGDGAVSPLACQCPPRTHGVACTPCDASMDCRTPRAQTVRLVALHIEGYGPLASGQDLAAACLDAALGSEDDGAANSVLYPVLGATAASLARATAFPDSAQLMGWWAWVAVAAEGAAAEGGDLASNLSACLTAPGRFPYLDRVEVIDTNPAAVVRQALSCGGRHWEWDDAAADCACVAGYELLVSDLDGAAHCMPCRNGTVRAKGLPGGCVPCLADAFQEAPYMGMAACACRAGYAADPVTGACSAAAAAFGGGAPGWYAPASAEDTIALWAGVSGGAALFGALALGCLCA